MGYKAGRIRQSGAMLIAVLFALTAISGQSSALAQGTAAPDYHAQHAAYAQTANRLQGLVIGIDAGHQAHPNYEKEPIAPGSKSMKAKTSAGTTGRWTHVPEYEVNLHVALKLKVLLEAEGARVVMTRETNDVDLSNIQRALIFNQAKTDLAIRLHCNGSRSKSVNGAFMLIPKKSPHSAECLKAAKAVLAEYAAATGAKKLGVIKRSDQTGFNWCERIIINIEMGHMTNNKEDQRLTSGAYQDRMTRGICNGILRYFKR
jgi:N-acetylmuramoyl-L-alanine amidase